MQKLKLLKQQLNNAIDVKYFLFFTIILIISMGFPFYAIIKSFINYDIMANETLIYQLQSYILIRYTLTVYILSTWGFIPKIFYASKQEGEVETLLTVGFSARDLWLIKSVVCFLVSLIIAIPINLILLFFLQYLAIGVMNIHFIVNVPAIFIGFVVNPMILFAIILFVGGFQLLTDDVRKSSLSIFIIGFVNMLLTFLVKPTEESNSIGIIYIIIFLILILINIILIKVLTTENVILSRFRLKNLFYNKRSIEL